MNFIMTKIRWFGTVCIGLVCEIR